MSKRRLFWLGSGTFSAVLVNRNICKSISAEETSLDKPHPSEEISTTVEIIRSIRLKINEIHNIYKDSRSKSAETYRNFIKGTAKTIEKAGEETAENGAKITGIVVVSSVTWLGFYRAGFFKRFLATFAVAFGTTCYFYPKEVSIQWQKLLQSDNIVVSALDRAKSFCMNIAFGDSPSQEVPVVKSPVTTAVDVVSKGYDLAQKAAVEEVEEMALEETSSS